jgi:UDP-N-acetylmuramoylalanine--D-glutamate ligase
MSTGINLKNKKVTILGAARSGIAAANLVVRLGGIAKLSEFKSQASSADELFGLDDQVLKEFGGHTRFFIEDSDYIVLSPGVRQDIEPVRWAREKNIPVIPEIELGFLFCRAVIVAVTGSNGKTTVSTLIAEILKRSGRGVCLCGNIGQPLTGFVLDLTENDTVVLEVSSFQLESTRQFRPHVGVLLNFSENHLDRHKDLEEYFQAKWMLFRNQQPSDFAVLNFGHQHMKDLASSLKSRVSFFNSPDKDVKGRNPNELAVLETARILGISKDVCEDVFRNFKGVEHRMEFVRTLGGVDYINDSKSTTAEATRWALERLSKPAFLICGGRDKNIDFSVLKNLVKAKVKRILAIGEAQDKVYSTFSSVVAVEKCVSLESAVGFSRQEAKAGECVILSPMCASFDMFKNFEHRGHVFKQIVNYLV